MFAGLGQVDGDDSDYEVMSGSKERASSVAVAAREGSGFAEPVLGLLKATRQLQLQGQRKEGR